MFARTDRGCSAANGSVTAPAVRPRRNGSVTAPAVRPRLIIGNAGMLAPVCAHGFDNSAAQSIPKCCINHSAVESNVVPPGSYRCSAAIGNVTAPAVRPRRNGSVTARAVRPGLIVVVRRLTFGQPRCRTASYSVTAALIDRLRLSAAPDMGIVNARKSGAHQAGANP